jgi:hypothetical protein
MLFNFRLRPLGEIQPWENPAGKQLGWFALTDGEYWIEAGAARLFEYGERVRRERGFPHFCDYHVSRLYEDVVEMLPGVLEPVPPDLRPYILLSVRGEWNGAVTAWLEGHRAELGDEAYREARETAHGWLRRRWLDSAYLRPSARIQMWSDEERVHVEWDNLDKMAEGVPVWTATAGAWDLPRAQFVAELQSFHDRLMAEMAERVERVRAGALPPEAVVNVAALEREQDFRAAPIDVSLLACPAVTDWNELREFMRRTGIGPKLT